MFFRLTNALAIFHHSIKDVFDEFLDKFFIYYLDRWYFNFLRNFKNTIPKILKNTKDM